MLIKKKEHKKNKNYKRNKKHKKNKTIKIKKNNYPLTKNLKNKIHQCQKLQISNNQFLLEKKVTIKIQSKRMNKNMNKISLNQERIHAKHHQLIY